MITAIIESSLYDVQDFLYCTCSVAYMSRQPFQCCLLIIVENINEMNIIAAPNLERLQLQVINELTSAV